jgi:hypothetical protein
VRTLAPPSLTLRPQASRTKRESRRLSFDTDPLSSELRQAITTLRAEGKPPATYERREQHDGSTEYRLFWGDSVVATVRLKLNLEQRVANEAELQRGRAYGQAARGKCLTPGEENTLLTAASASQAPVNVISPSGCASLSKAPLEFRKQHALPRQLKRGIREVKRIQGIQVVIPACDIHYSNREFSSSPRKAKADIEVELLEILVGNAWTRSPRGLKVPPPVSPCKET